MTLLIAGVGLWWVAHLFKRLAPGPRRALDDRMGDGAARGLFAGLILLSVVLMYFGYTRALTDNVYSPPAWGRHANNLLMLIAFITFGMGMSKGVLWTRLRHPMLTGVVIWSLAHLLVRGDLASLVLFLGLGLWAIVAMLLINQREGGWVRPRAGAAKRDVALVAIATASYGVVAWIHMALGYPVFPG